MSEPAKLKHVATARRPGEIWQLRGKKIGGVHFRDDCVGRTCVIHSPTRHHMSEWYLLFRNDRSIFERLCEHGVGHPDPDQFDYWEEVDREYEAIHGCDGCCQQDQGNLLEWSDAPSTD